MTDLRSMSRAPRNLDEAHRILSAMARKMGFIYGVYLSVGVRGDCMYFVDEGGLDIIDPGGLDNPASSVLCATAKEIDTGAFLQLFAGRALYASIVIRFNMADLEA